MSGNSMAPFLPSSRAGLVLGFLFFSLHALASLSSTQAITDTSYKPVMTQAKKTDIQASMASPRLRVRSPAALDAVQRRGLLAGRGLPLHSINGVEEE